MLLLLLIASALPPPVKIASPGLKVVDISADRASFYGQHFASQMAVAGVEMITEREISAILGLERQKALLGCSEESGCLVELANALGVQGILVGDIAKIGNRYQTSLKIIDAGNGQPLAVQSFRVKDEEGLIDALSTAAFEMAGEVQRKLGRVVLPRAAAATVPRRSWWIPALGGAVVAGAGAVCLGASLSDFARLSPVRPPSTLTQVDARDTASRGKALQTTAVVLFAAGAAAALGAVGIAAFGTEPRVLVVATPEGAGLSFSGRLP